MSTSRIGGLIIGLALAVVPVRAADNLTVYYLGNSLTAKPYEQFDPQADAALIKALQETIWAVVTHNPQTGVTGP